MSMLANLNNEPDQVHTFSVTVYGNIRKHPQVRKHEFLSIDHDHMLYQKSYHEWKKMMHKFCGQLNQKGGGYKNEMKIVSKIATK